MGKRIKLWRMDTGELKEVPAEKLPYEDKIHDALEKGLSLISDDLLILGSHVATDFGTEVDILGIEANGDIVIIELKRDKTPSEIMSQALGYAAWASGIDYEMTLDIAKGHYGSEDSFREEFSKKFDGNDIPDTVNSAHKIILVAGSLDSNTENIIKYLSEQYGVPINAVLFEYFKDDQGEFLSKTTVIEEETAKLQTISRKRSRYVPLTIEQVADWANNIGITEIYNKAFEFAHNAFTWPRPLKQGVSFDLRVEEESRSCRRTVLSFYLNESSADKGLYVFVYEEPISKYFDFDVGEWVARFNGSKVAPYGTSYPGYEFYLKEDNQLLNFFTPFLQSD